MYFGRTQSVDDSKQMLETYYCVEFGVWLARRGK